MTYRDTPLEEITVPENRLRELRDYSALATSMDEVGLIQPITVTEGGILVAGRHRIEAAKSLGWREIAAFVVEDDALANRLAEIDENLRRLDLTVYEQSKHADERERVLEAMGQRRAEGGSGSNQHGSNPATAAGFQKTTADVANEAGVSERSWQGRVKIGRGLGDKTRAALDNADPSEDKHRAFLNSTSQLDHLANISEKRGDDQAAQTAERVLNGEYKSTFDAYPEVKQSRPLKGEDRRPAKESVSEDVELPPWDLPPERKAYYRISKQLVSLSRMEPEAVAEAIKDEYDADVNLEHAEAIRDWFGRYEEAVRQKRKQLRPGNLRAVEGG